MTRRLLCIVIAGALALLGVGIGSGEATAAPVVGPALTVTPTTDLASGDEVTVSGSGFHKNSRLWVMQTLRLPSLNMPQLPTVKKQVSTDAQGRFRTALKVQQRFAGLDCAKTQCYVATAPVLPNIDPSQLTSVPIAFDGAGDAGRPGPRLVVAPKTDLQRGSEVRVVGTGFERGTALRVVQTVARPDDGRPVTQSEPVAVTADRAGRFTTTVKVAPKIGDVNCLQTDCFIAAYPVEPTGAAGKVNDAWEPIAFDGSDNTLLDVDVEQMLQAETARISIAGAQPLDTYLIKVEGPGEFSAQPHVHADADGKATVLMMSNFDQAVGAYTVHFTNQRTGAVTTTGFSVGTNALFQPDQASGEEVEEPAASVAPGLPAETPVTSSATGPEADWTPWWLIATIVIAAIIFAVIGWFARDSKA